MRHSGIDDAFPGRHSAPPDLSAQYNTNSVEMERQHSKRRSFSSAVSLHTASSSQPTTLALSTSLHRYSASREKPPYESPHTSASALHGEGNHDILYTPSPTIPDMEASASASVRNNRPPVPHPRDGHRRHRRRHRSRHEREEKGEAEEKSDTEEMREAQESPGAQPPLSSSISSVPRDRHRHRHRRHRRHGSASPASARADSAQEVPGGAVGAGDPGGADAFTRYVRAADACELPAGQGPVDARHSVRTQSGQMWGVPHSHYNTNNGEEIDESLLVPCGVMEELPQPRRLAKYPDVSRNSSDGNFAPFSPRSALNDSTVSIHASEEESSVCSDSLEPQWERQPCMSCCVDYSDREGWRRQRPRRHAFQRPLHYLQVVAVSVTVFIMILFFSSVVPSYSYLYSLGIGRTEIVIMSIITLSTVLLMWGAWFTVSFYENGDIEGEGEPCGFCQRHTQLSSRHCKSCNKCISGFDHHCKWLNVCIGKKNYRFFILYAVSTLAALVTVLFVSLLLLSRWWSELALLSLYFRVAPLVTSILVVLVILPLTQLILFHVMLRWLGLTTYDYLMQRRREANPQ